jgi:hypothetical protein
MMARTGTRGEVSRRCTVEELSGGPKALEIVALITLIAQGLLGWQGREWVQEWTCNAGRWRQVPPPTHTHTQGVGWERIAGAASC